MYCVDGLLFINKTRKFTKEIEENLDGVEIDYDVFVGKKRYLYPIIN